MAGPSLYERYLAELRSEENWAEKPVEMFRSYARDKLSKEGHRIDDTDPLHDLAIYGRAREIRDSVAEFCAHVDEAHAAKIKSKGGRPPKGYFAIITLAAAYYRRKAFGPDRKKTELCREAAKALGKPITRKVVSDALKVLPRIAAGFQSQLGKEASKEEGASMLFGVLRAAGKALLEMERTMQAEADQAEAAKATLRHAPGVRRPR